MGCSRCNESSNRGNESSNRCHESSNRESNNVHIRASFNRNDFCNAVRGCRRHENNESSNNRCHHRNRCCRRRCCGFNWGCGW